MPTKDNNTIKYNHGEKSMKLPYICRFGMLTRKN